MASVELECMKCHSGFAVDGDALAASAGKSAYMKCPKCRHRDSVPAFAATREKTLRGVAKREAKDHKQAALDAERKRIDEAAEEAKRERDREAVAAEEQRKREVDELEADDQRKVKAMHEPVPCPICSCGCSPLAITCMQCGHPMGEDVFSPARDVTDSRINSAEQARIVGAVIAALGVIAFTGVCTGGGAAVAAGAGSLVIVGIVIWMLASIWEALERIAGGRR